MLQRLIIILLGTMVLFLSSCQQDDEDFGNGIIDNSDEVPVKFSFSMGGGMDFATGYEPMRSAIDTRDDSGDMIKAGISNTYKVVFVKKIGSRWILEKTLEIMIDPADKFNEEVYDVTDSTAFSFSTDLRPGEYKVTVFTGIASISWNNDLKPGYVVNDENVPNYPVPYACIYRTVSDGYGFLNPGHKYLEEEMFAGTTDFTVKRTEDLHSSSLISPIFLKLNRKVTKLRILLHYLPSATDKNFFNSFENGITADVISTNNVTFPIGMDIWSNPYYGPNDTITRMKYGVFCWREPQLSSVTGETYLMSMKKGGTKQHSLYYFSDPAKDIVASLANVEVTASSWVNINFSYREPVPNILLKYNHINGVVFRPGDDTWVKIDKYGNNIDMISMDLEVDSNDKPINAASIFDNYYEYKNDTP